MATCTITLNSSVAAVSGRVKYKALPNQVVSDAAIDTTEITASIDGNDYTATLVQGAKYRVIAPLFSFIDTEFEVPAEAAADLQDLLTGVDES